MSILNFRNPKKTARILLFSGILGIGIALFVRDYWLTVLFPYGSKRLLLATIMAAILGGGTNFLITSWMQDRLSALSLKDLLELSLASMVVGILLFFGVTSQWQNTSQYITSLLPTHSLELTIRPNSPNYDVTIPWFNTSLGEISLGTISYKGWTRDGDVLTLNDPKNNQLLWKGKPGEKVEIVIDNISSSGDIWLAWDGVQEIYPLLSTKYSYKHSFDIPLFASHLCLLLLGVLFFSFISFPLLSLVWPARYEFVKRFQSVARYSTIPQNKFLELGCLVCLIGLAVLLRAPNLGNLPPHANEYDHLLAAKQILMGASLQSVYQRSLYIVTLPVSIFFRIFGVHLWVARLAGVLFNSMAIIPLYYLTKKVNFAVALLACGLYITSPWVIAEARNVREYAYYPFIFYLILYGMISFLARFPFAFNITQWKELVNTKNFAYVLFLTFPIFWGFILDPLSTLKVIVAIYPVFLLFLLSRFNWRDRTTLLFLLSLFTILAIIGSTLLISQGGVLFRSLETTAGKYLAEPIRFFFPTPPQQWYFDREAIIPVLGLAAVFLLSVLFERKYFLPLYFSILFSTTLLGFVYFFPRYIQLRYSINAQPRYFFSIELWYIPTLATGLFGLWIIIKMYLKRKIFLYFSLVCLLLLFANPRQILLPATSNLSHDPITGINHPDIREVQSFLMGKSVSNDVLICTRYCKYVDFVGQPKFANVFSFNPFSKTPKSDILSIIKEYDSGWIVIDNTSFGLSNPLPLSTEKSSTEGKIIDYIGLFRDQYLWHWSLVPSK